MQEQGFHLLEQDALLANEARKERCLRKCITGTTAEINSQTNDVAGNKRC